MLSKFCNGESLVHILFQLCWVLISYQDKQAVFTSLFNSISENFHILLLKSVLLTSVASFVLFAIDFSSVAFTTSSEKINKMRDSHFQIKCPCYNRVGVKTKWFALSIHRARAFRFVSRTKPIMTRPFKELVQIINDTVQFSYSWIYLFSVSLFAALPGRGPGVVKKRKKLLTLKPLSNDHDSWW